MGSKRTTGILGTGAVGGYYGALLQKAGFDVHFLLHSDYHHVKKKGLSISSPGGDFHLSRVNAYRNAADMPPCDLVLLTLKTTSNHLLPELLPPVIKPGGIVLTLQNGLGSEEEIAAIAGPDAVMGGLCFLCSNKTGPGRIVHLDYGLITVGEFKPDGSPGGVTDRLNRITEDLQRAGIPAKPVEDLLLARWKKLVWNIPFNGMSVLHNTLTDQLVKHPDTRARCERMMHEVAMASAACARPIEPEFLKKMIMDTEKMRPYAPSMKLDYDRGNPMELESIYGNPIRAARKMGIEMKETQKLYEQLRKINPVI